MRRRRRGRFARFARLSMLFAVAALTVVLLGSLVCWFVFPFPIERLDRWPESPRVTDRRGREMISLVGTDDQWRFPVALQDVSPWIIQATVAVEDERFRYHPGVDPIAIGRATWQNITQGRIVSGASTLTMQVCRMMDRNPRTLRSKLSEAFRALQLECLRDKDEILELYLNVAPYGGNLRGVEAASRYYFGKPAADLSLAEASLLAGLPQSPSRYRIDRHSEAAKLRRAVVLMRMQALGMISLQAAEAAMTEPTRVVAHRLNALRAPHAAWHALSLRPSGSTATIDLSLQSALENCVSQQARSLPRGTDLAAVVIDIPTGDVIAMVGSADPGDGVDGSVNGVLARRSPGSALKPFVYAAAFEANRLCPESIVYDIQVSRGGWSPRNINRTFAGPVSVADALRRSLNVPAILIAEAIGLGRCLGVLDSVGVRLSHRKTDRARLGIAVGTVEVRLLDLTNAYATLGRGGIHKPIRFSTEDTTHERRVLRAEVCAAIDSILNSRGRLPAGLAGTPPARRPWFMWKTGTSSGRRDAVAVGHNRSFAIGVWVGRFSGGGDGHYVGAEAAEPLLTALFSLPQFRRDDQPPQTTHIIVRRPLPPPREMREPLRILQPSNGTTFVALDGSISPVLKANQDSRLSWFLNGRLIQLDASGRAQVRTGTHKLRCVDQAGRAASIRFEVIAG